MKHLKTLGIAALILLLLFTACTPDTPPVDENQQQNEQNQNGDGSDSGDGNGETGDGQQSGGSETGDGSGQQSGDGSGSGDGQSQGSTYTGQTSVVTFAPEVANQGKTFSGLAPLPVIDYTIIDPANTRGLSTEKFGFSYGVAKNGEPHHITVNNQKRFDGFGTNALAWDNQTNKEEAKVLYLTFDCGYVYGTLTEDMLDILKEKQVPAAFFCTLDYLGDAPETVTRMITEGHIVGNHSTTHPSDSAAIGREKLGWELLGVENYLRANFGYSSKYFRFPTGAYSEDALDLVNSVGYRSVFWSIAHADWDPKNQPGVQKSFDTVTSRLHPGAVILLHSTSPDNAAILADFIDFARQQGYEFRSLDQYPGWN
ncbi:MAG: hypothetical protein E7223_06990 [Clostridiales bacterium]|nr:hypothetical protein [Clostridiales bacterium]